jgi:S-DNA-T family DNA segregation ATPase FtsK/SpoIIIE
VGTVSSTRLRIQYADGRIADRILRDGIYTVGRESGDIVLPDPNVSGRHAELHVQGGAVRIQDCGSTNGTWEAGGERITASFLLSTAHRVRIGNCLIFVAEQRGHTTAPPSSDDPSSPLSTDTPLSPYRLPDTWKERVRRDRRE